MPFAVVEVSCQHMEAGTLKPRATGAEAVAAPARSPPLAGCPSSASNAAQLHQQNGSLITNSCSVEEMMLREGDTKPLVWKKKFDNSSCVCGVSLYTG